MMFPRAKNHPVAGAALLTVLVSTPSLMGQAPVVPNAVRDQQAVQIVTQAIAKLGGASAYELVKDVITEGSCEAVDPSTAQGQSSTMETQSSNTHIQTPSSHFKWTIAGDEYRYETIHGANSDILASGHGRPANSTATGVRRVAAYQLRPPYHLPGLLLYRELANHRYTLRYMGQKQMTQGMVTWVQTAVMGPQRPMRLTTQDWYFGADGTPVEMDYFVASESAVSRLVEVTLDFSQYQPFNGKALPTTISASMAGRRKGICTITKTDINTFPDASIFDLR